MVRQYGSPLHEELRRLVIEQRRKAKISQATLAKRLRWSQQTVSKIETGEKRLTVVEFVELGQALGFDPPALLRRVMRS